MKKLYLIPTLSVLIGFGFWAAYAIKGSHLAPDGTLIEPFYLIPTGWLFIFIGCFIAVFFTGFIVLFLVTKKVDKLLKRKNRRLL